MRHEAPKEQKDGIIRGMTMAEILAGKAPQWIADQVNPPEEQKNDEEENDVPSSGQDPR